MERESRPSALSAGDMSPKLPSKEQAEMEAPGMHQCVRRQSMRKDGGARDEDRPGRSAITSGAYGLKGSEAELRAWNRIGAITNASESAYLIKQNGQ